MTIRKIAKMGHPILRKIAQPIPIEQISSPKIQKLIDDMLETVLDANGAGLAAPQVHESKRIVILELDEKIGFQVWINPIITSLTEDHMLTFEGCLSVPGLRGAVARPTKISVQALDRNGKDISMVLEGFSAVIAQHECDHLDGVLYVDRVETQTLAYMDEYRKYNKIMMDQLFLDEE